MKSVLTVSHKLIYCGQTVHLKDVIFYILFSLMLLYLLKKFKQNLFFLSAHVWSLWAGMTQSQKIWGWFSKLIERPKERRNKDNNEWNWRLGFRYTVNVTLTTKSLHIAWRIPNFKFNFDLEDLGCFIWPFFSLADDPWMKLQSSMCNSGPYVELLASSQTCLHEDKFDWMGLNVLTKDAKQHDCEYYITSK